MGSTPYHLTWLRLDRQGDVLATGHHDGRDLALVFVDDWDAVWTDCYVRLASQRSPGEIRQRFFTRSRTRPRLPSFDRTHIVVEGCEDLSTEEKDAVASTSIPFLTITETFIKAQFDSTIDAAKLDGANAEATSVARALEGR